MNWLLVANRKKKKAMTKEEQEEEEEQEEQEEEDKETMTKTDSDFMLKGCKERMLDLTRISLFEEVY